MRISSGSPLSRRGNRPGLTSRFEVTPDNLGNADHSHKVKRRMANQVTYEEAPNSNYSEDCNAFRCQATLPEIEQGAVHAAKQIPPGSREREKQEKQSEHSRVEKRFENAAVHV